jgi:hypothetical protein
LYKYGAKILILFLVLLPVLPVRGQPRSARRTERKIERREASLERKERRDYEKRRREALKHRYSIQTKEVQERMKESRKKAERFNRSKREPFFRALLQKMRKKPRKRRPR